MKSITWSSGKNRLLQEMRGISFEEVVHALEHGGLLTILGPANPARYPNQRRYIVALRGYAYIVPVVETDEEIFLKTMIPSRQMTRRYLRKELP